MQGKRMPECRAHHDCFANHDGVCHCLNDNNFNGKDCQDKRMNVCSHPNPELLIFKFSSVPR